MVWPDLVVLPEPDIDCDLGETAAKSYSVPLSRNVSAVAPEVFFGNWLLENTFPISAALHRLHHLRQGTGRSTGLLFHGPETMSGAARRVR